MPGSTTKRNVLILAVLLGLVTSALVWVYLRTPQTRGTEETARVVVATRDISPRTIIDPSMITTQEIPRSKAPKDAFGNEADVLGKVAVVNITRDKALSRGDIEAKGISLGLSYVIPLSMRAVTVSIDPVIGVGGYPKPGDHVDVVASYEVDRQAKARTVLQNVELLAMGSKLEDEERLKKEGQKQSVTAGKDTATLLVTPSQAEELVLAENNGKLRLSLRAVGDETRVATAGATLRVGAEPTKVAVRPVSYTHLTLPTN